MRTSLLAILLVALLMAPAQAYHEGIGSGDPPNRAPVARAGPDQRVGESDIILLNGDNSFDPDPDDNDDLTYIWSVEERPQFVSGTPPQAFDVPIQVAQECIVEDQMGIELEDWMQALHAPYIPPGTPSKVELVLNLTVYDQDPAVVDDLWPLGLPYDVESDGINEYDHGWTGKVDSTGDPIWYTAQQNRTAYANYTNHKSWDTLTVTVDNTNQAPHGDIFRSTGRVRSLCDEPHYIEFMLRHFRTGIDDTFEAPFPEYEDSADVDIWEHRDDFIEFYVQAFDDEEIGLVEVYLYHDKLVAAYEKEKKEEFVCQIDDVDETYRFALGRHSVWEEPFEFPAGGPGTPAKKTDYPDQLYRGQTLRTFEQLENWTGRMPVSTPELVEGEYRVCARAFDRQGAWQIADPEAAELSVSESLQKNQSPPCLSILAPGIDRAITPPVPDELPAKVPIKSFACRYPSPTTCDTFPVQVLGIGGVVRLDVGIVPWSLPGEPDYEPDTAFLLEKVLIQNELDTPTGPMLGPETRLEAPFVINLDTLASETRRVYVRAFDRVGGESGMCIEITPDPVDPKVLGRVPEDVYWAVESTWRYYLQDKVPAISLQTITGFDLAKETTASSSSNDHVTVARTGEALVLPPLGAFPHYDVTGDGFVDAVLDKRSLTEPIRLTDVSKRTYDAVWDYEAQELLALSTGRCDEGRTMDFWIESDGERGCGEDEMRILAAEPGKTPDGLAPTAAQRLPAASLPTDGELFGFLLSARTTLLEHKVTPSGEQPMRTYAWHTVITDDAQNTMFLKGGVDLSRYYTDLGIVSLELLDPLAGRLPGDPVNLTGTIRHESGIEGVALNITYAWDSDPWGAYRDMELLDQKTRHDEMVKAGQILVYQCQKGGKLTPCPVELGKTAEVRLNRTFSPGVHEVTLHVHPDPLVDENITQNNTASKRFEIYLGRTDTANGAFYIRAGDRGMPRLADGAIDLTDNKTYDLRLGEFTSEEDADKGARTVYLFEVAGETYYWDPVERRDPADTKKTCHLAGDTFTANCRPITVVQEAHVPPPDEDTPGLALFAVVGLLISAVALARRRR